MEEAFYKKLPKLELHAHLNGSLSAETLKELGCNPSSIEEYRNLAILLEKTEKTLQDCFQVFKIAHNATNTIEAVYRATETVIKDFYEDGVVYLELRTTPREELDKMTKEQYVESVVKAINSNKLPIIVKLILSIDRGHNLENNREALELIINFKNKYPDIVKGIDLSGNPSFGQFNKELFVKARKNGLSVTLHCAEIANEKEVQEMLQFKPERMGHGTYLHPLYGGNEKNWPIYLEKNIPVECCLTSNVVCCTSKSYEKHHIQEWINNKLPFCINTDDKGVFCTSLTKEYSIVAREFHLTREQMWEICFETIEYAFCNQLEKEQLRERLKQWKRDYIEK